MDWTQIINRRLDRLMTLSACRCDAYSRVALGHFSACLFDLTLTKDEILKSIHNITFHCLFLPALTGSMSCGTHRLKLLYNTLRLLGLFPGANSQGNPPQTMQTRSDSVCWIT